MRDKSKVECEGLCGPGLFTEAQQAQTCRLIGAQPRAPGSLCVPEGGALHPGLGSHLHMTRTHGALSLDLITVPQMGTYSHSSR